MKKTFRFFGMMLCIMLTAVCFSACSDDDDDKDNDSSIVGTWKHIRDGYESIFTFNADGTLLNIDGDGDTNTGKYTYKNNILTIWWDDDEYADDPSKVSVKGDRLTFYDEDGSSIVYVRVSDEDEDDEPINNDNSSIVGSWKLTNAEDDYESIITFKADGTVIAIERDLDDGDEYRDTGKYTFDGEIVTIWWDDEYDDPDVYEVSVKGNRLTLHEDGYSIIYVRV